MTATDASVAPDSGFSDPIDLLVPRPRPWWFRLVVATIAICGVGLIGYGWQFGLLRPAPDCCGSGDSMPQLGLSHQDGAATVVTYFFNSSPRAITIDSAEVSLDGASVVDVAPFVEPGAWQMPPQELAPFPYRVEAHSSVWLAISFVPERCDGDGGDWGSVTLDLAVADGHWYPTFGRTYSLVDPIVGAGPGRLGMLPPAALDDALQGIDRPLEGACALLGRN